MSQAANYSAIEVMRDGRSVELRARQPGPPLFGSREYVQAGGLLSYGPSRPL